MGNSDVRVLIDGLEDFRTRSDCIRELTRAGEAAVEPLVDAMDTAFSEGARWAIIRCLGAIGDRRAIPALAALLQERNMAREAREALTAITGRDLGPAPGPWLKETPARVGGEDAEMRKTGLDETRLLELIFDRADTSYEKIGEGRYSAEIPVEGAAKQSIRIRFGEKDHEGEPIVIVYSRCGRAAPRHYEQALRRNLKMPYGALAVSGAGDSAQFVMFNTLLRQDMSAVELRKSLFTVAERSGRMRQELSAEESG